MPNPVRSAARSCGTAGARTRTACTTGIQRRMTETGRNRMRRMRHENLPHSTTYLKRDGMKMPFKSPFQTEGESQRNGGMQDVESHCHDGPTHKGSRTAAGGRYAGLFLPHRL